jgi:hypothetical protein
MKYEQKAALYNELIAKCGFEKKGKALPYTSVNGHMFSQLNKNGELGIRFPKDTQEKYLKELNTTTYKSYGAIMKGYVLIPEKFWHDLNTLAQYLQESHDYTQTLKPK